MSPSPTLFPSPSPSFDAEKQPIYDGLMRYLNMFDRLLRDPKSEQPADIASVATGEEGVAMRTIINRAIELDRKRAGGPVAYHGIRISSPKTINGFTHAEVTYCKDLSQMTLVRLDGSPRPSSDRPLAQFETVTMEKMPDSSWIAARVTNERRQSC